MQSEDANQMDILFYVWPRNSNFPSLVNDAHYHVQRAPPMQYNCMMHGLNVVLYRCYLWLELTTCWR